MSQVIHFLTDEGLTEFSFLFLFRRQRKRGEQLHEYLDNNVVHRVCRRNLGIDLEATEEESNRLEQIYQSIVIADDALDRLICLDVKKMHAGLLKKGTYRE